MKLLQRRIPFLWSQHKRAVYAAVVQVWACIDAGRVAIVTSIFAVALSWCAWCLLTRASGRWGSQPLASRSGWPQIGVAPMCAKLLWTFSNRNNMHFGLVPLWFQSMIPRFCSRMPVGSCDGYTSLSLTLAPQCLTCLLTTAGMNQFKPSKMHLFIECVFSAQVEITQCFSTHSHKFLPRSLPGHGRS